MGYQNMGLVFARWGHLPDRPFRLLMFMALRSLDEDDPPRFYEGREAAAFAIGKLVPEEPAAGDESDRAQEFRKARRNDFEAVKVATRALIKAGVISIIEPSAPGRNAVYGLHLLASTGKGYPAQRGRLTPATGKTYPGEQGGVTPSPTEAPPTGELHENTKITPNSSQVTNSPAAVEIDYAEANSILGSLPNLGTDYISRVDEEIVGYKNRVIAAARLYLAEKRSAS